LNEDNCGQFIHIETGENVDYARLSEGKFAEETYGLVEMVNRMGRSGVFFFERSPRNAILTCGLSAIKR
jgi:hypothetical protein